MTRKGGAAQDGGIGRVKRLVAEIRKEARELAPSFWSPEQLSGVEQPMKQLAAEMQSASQEILKNLMWYKLYGWKRFVPDPSDPRFLEAESGEKQEKERLEKWSKQFYQISTFAEENRKRRELDFAALFREQVAEYKLLELLLRHGFSSLHEARVLDIGCGDGRSLRKFIEWGAAPERLAGVDVNEPILKLAGHLSSPAVTYVHAHADQLPFEERTFDIVLLFGVLQHVLDESLRRSIVRDALRVLKDDGIIVTLNLQRHVEKKLMAYLSYTTSGLSEEELTRIFPDCEVEFAGLLLTDTVVARQVPAAWGTLYDQALDPADARHDYGLAVIRKRKADG